MDWDKAAAYHPKHLGFTNHTLPPEAQKVALELVAASVPGI